MALSLFFADFTSLIPYMWFAEPRVCEGGWGNQAYSRLSTTHGHIADCKLDSVVSANWRYSKRQEIPVLRTLPIRCSINKKSMDFYDLFAVFRTPLFHIRVKPYLTTTKNKLTNLKYASSSAVG